MKTLVLILVLLATMATAFADCTISSGPAETQFEILFQGDQTVRFDAQSGDQVIYTCVAKATKVVNTEHVQNVQITANSCVVVTAGGHNDVIYCQP